MYYNIIYNIKNNKMVRRRINRIKRTYTRARGILGASNMLQNPAIVGALAGIFKNVANGQPPINIRGIQRRITQPNAKNPLLYFVLGHLMHNKALQAIGAFQIVDPPVLENIDDMSDEEIEAMAEEEGEEVEEDKKICIH